MVVKCEVCGYTWTRGEDGCHSCIEEVKNKTDNIEKKLNKLERRLSRRSMLSTPPAYKK